MQHLSNNIFIYMAESKFVISSFNNKNRNGKSISSEEQNYDFN